MAGFQLFPIPKHIYTRAYWAYTPNNIARRNIFFGLASSALISAIILRYAVMRSQINAGVGSYVSFDHQNAPRAASFPNK